MQFLKFLSLFLFLTSSLLAQPSWTQRYLPVVSPPSPEAAAFSKYGNYEVNLFTGIPSISIPIYEIKVGEIRVPISLNYHPSGVRVTDMASRVGLGWDLQAGGAVTRKIMGKPDELTTSGYLAATPTSEFRVKLTTEIDRFTEAGLQYLENVEQRNYDVEPDIFSYSYPGSSGKFLFNQKNNFKPILIPMSSDSIAMSYSTNSLDLGIFDSRGIHYKFNEKESTNISGATLQISTSAWQMSDIISSNKQDTVHFNYFTRSGSAPTGYYFSDYMILGDNCTGSYNGPGCTTVGDYYRDVTASVFNTWKQLTQIDFKNGKVVFENSASAREDFSGTYDVQKALTAIKVYSYDAYNRVHILVKSVQFFHSYFINGLDNATKRLKLDSIQVRTSTGSVVQTYKFDYNLSVSLPNYNSRAKDYWGFYNGVTDNVDPFGYPTMIPQMQVQYNPASPGTPFMVTVGGSRADARDPNPSFMQAWVLQKITYPTGGSTQFEYETNQYLNEQSVVKYAGGLRIKTIKSYTDASSIPVVKTYKYGANEVGYGRANFFLEDHFFVSSRNLRKDPINAAGNCEAPPGYYQKTTRTFFANPTLELEGYDGAPVVYPVVTEYIGDETANAGKTIYAYSDKPDAKTTQFALGKPIVGSYHYTRGLLIGRQDFRRNANGTYTIVAESRKKYQYFSDQSSSGGIGLGVFKHTVFEGYTGLQFTSCGGSGTPNTDSYSFDYNNYEIVSGDNKLVSDTVISYDEKDPLKYSMVVTNFNYDDLTHLQNTQVQKINSNGETVTTAFKYPYHISGEPYVTMTSKHIWEKQVEEKLSSSVYGQQFLKTNVLQSYAGNNYLPGSVKLRVKTFTEETRASFNSYDLSGNILEMQKMLDVKQSFIWDYQGMNIVAEATNAAQADIAATSFESDSKGNWTYVGFTDLDPSSPTGKRYYTISNSVNNLTKSGLSSSKTYIVSYWKKSGTVTVNAGSGTPGLTVSGWTYFEHKVVNPTGGLITVSGTNGIIDELRLYPVLSQMTTYTHIPLVGVMSKCDPNNRIVYYEYDNIGRLMLIRDQDKNIVKEFSYNYWGQPETSSIVYNHLQTAAFSRQGCTSCLTGSTVTYIVPDGTYSAPTLAEANQLAIQDITANGQAYANVRGSCVTPPNANVSSSNGTSSNKSFYFKNNCTNTIYNFSRPANSTLSVVGTLPAGTYLVHFNSSSSSYRFMVNGISGFGNGGDISNIVVGTGGVTVVITP